MTDEAFTLLEGAGSNLGGGSLLGPGHAVPSADECLDPEELLEDSTAYEIESGFFEQVVAILASGFVAVGWMPVPSAFFQPVSTVVASSYMSTAWQQVPSGFVDPLPSVPLPSGFQKPIMITKSSGFMRIQGTEPWNL